MVRMWAAAVLLMAGCEAIESNGKIMEPRASSAPTAGTTTASDGAQGDFNFAAQDRVEGDEVFAERDANISDLYAGLGVEPIKDAEAPTPQVIIQTPAPPPTPVVPQMAAAQPWEPGVPIEGSWGVRLVSTVIDAQPPRAILGLPDGSEQVVQPGTLLPSARLVVLAIGRDAVQIAEIIPEGDRARVSPQTLHALYPSNRPTE